MFDLKAIGLSITAIYAAAYALKSAAVKLKYFAASEFGVWWPFLDNDLLYGLDAFRQALGVPVQISPAHGAIGRVGKEAENSQHFLLESGQLRAIDILIPENVSLEHAYNVAKSLGIFSGIGVYPDWSPRHGLHLDTRKNKVPDNPATWSGLKVVVNGVPKQIYKNVERGFV